MITYEEILERLDHIHNEVIGDPTTEEINAAWAQGHAPCGCAICNLRIEIVGTLIERGPNGL